jgi:hypothetical protein
MTTTKVDVEQLEPEASWRGGELDKNGQCVLCGEFESGCECNGAKLWECGCEDCLDMMGINDVLPQPQQDLE